MCSREIGLKVNGDLPVSKRETIFPFDGIPFICMDTDTQFPRF